LLAAAQDVAGASVVVCAVENMSPDEMRQLIDVLRRKRPTGLAVLLAAAVDGKVQLVAGLSKDLIERGLHAGNWLKEVAPIVGGGGGGRSDMAQAGGKAPEKIPEALEHGAKAIRDRLQA
jgi:alanyl-tRNA synthetase